MFEHLQDWLAAFPPAVIYIIVGLIIGAESMGIPLPGEVTLISAALLSASGVGEPWWVAIAAATGAIIGDTIGYTIGRKGGRPLLERVGRRFPKHFGPAHLAKAESLFARWGVWAVFFGRFVALLRILAGPLAGALRVPYTRFLVANASGGIVWAFGTVFLVYYVGAKVEAWLKGASWVMLGAALLFGVITTIILKRKAQRAMADPQVTASEVSIVPTDSSLSGK
ncbi:membrane protein DedA with SNARE-associated domain [Allocatelliglobosispora scoriae]|uniref:Membrane protein DedA with SNARE-associated domain n=1 Tax=Allocatelliglobosispora scoriae TaxID=643052 RepID=A0A841BRZ3_9ACTN|nr:DedA family protein [Allocatelliglobosispora scoriae]MBB5869581.1 membrane protein DedA with SNARE-associated domain [Allocatelliglobosispora scoriae]